MTRCLDLLLGLMVRWFVLVMVWAVVCWLRCWRECRGFAQLREGSDDPPPPVRTGASAWADATPKPASRPSRTIIIVRVRRRRETKCMKPKPLHQMLSGANAACITKFFLSESRPLLNTSPRNRLCESWPRPVVFATSSAFYPTTQPADNTHGPSRSPMTMNFLVEQKYLFTTIIWNWEHGRRPSGLGVLYPLVGLLEFPSSHCGDGACMPASNSCQHQSTVVWWWGRKRSAGSLGDEP